MRRPKHWLGSAPLTQALRQSRRKRRLAVPPTDDQGDESTVGAQVSLVTERRQARRPRFPVKAWQLAIDQRRQLFAYGYHLRSTEVSSNGRNFSATASRARKMRERTVPIGQLITTAISS